MSVRLGWRLSVNRKSIPPETVDVTSVTDADLRYRLFNGHVEFQVGTCDLNPPWDWTPVLDLAASLVWIVESLQTADEARFEFTESEHAVFFRRVDRAIHVSATYTQCEGSCSFEELTYEIRRFAAAVVGEVQELAPTIAFSEAFLDLQHRMLSA